MTLHPTIQFFLAIAPYIASGVGFFVLIQRGINLRFRNDKLSTELEGYKERQKLADEKTAFEIEKIKIEVEEYKKRLELADEKRTLEIEKLKREKAKDETILVSREEVHKYFDKILKGDIAEFLKNMEEVSTKFDVANQNFINVSEVFKNIAKNEAEYILATKYKPKSTGYIGSKKNIEFGATYSIRPSTKGFVNKGFIGETKFKG